MATCSKQRTKLNTSSTLLFQNPTVSKEASQVFVRKLVAMAISNVTYLRGIFPESVYADRELEGLQLKILRGNETCPAASQLVQWLSGAFDALQKNYLRKIILGVHEEGAQPDDVLETYTFTFTYVGDKLDTCHVVQGGKSAQKTLAVCTDPKAVLRCAMEMLRGTLFLVQTLDPLPGNIMLSMKLFYYDEVTPEEYEPPGFRPAENMAYNFESDPLSIKVGEVSTPYHSLMFNCKTDSTKFDAIRKLSESTENMSVDDDTANEKQTPHEDITSVPTELRGKLQQDKPEEHFPDEYIPASQNATTSFSHPQQNSDITSLPTQLRGKLQQDKPEEDFPDEYIPASQIPTTSFSDPRQNSVKPAESVTNLTVPAISPEAPVSAIMDASSPDELQPTKCVCGGDKEGGIMVLCSICHSWNHAACYGFKAETDIPESFVCLQCHDESKGQICTDSKLLSLQPNQRQEICLYRRALVICEDTSRISAATLCREMDINRTTANDIVEHLVSDRILKQAKTKGASRMVNQELLKKNILGQYFGPTATLGLEPDGHENAVEKSIKGIEEMQLTPPRGRILKHSLNKISVSPTEEMPPGKRRKLSRADMGIVLSIR